MAKNNIFQAKNDSNSPKKVQIGYKLDKNTHLVSIFENIKQKYIKVKIQQNMDDFC